MYNTHISAFSLRKNSEAMNERMLMDTTSPIDAAKGVAKLSGFILNRWDIMITAIMTKSIKVKSILSIIWTSIYQCTLLHLLKEDTSYMDLYLIITNIKCNNLEINGKKLQERKSYKEE